MKIIIILIINMTALFSLADCLKKEGNVVFFDFNESPEEVAGAKKIAEQKCQDFHVVQSEDAAQKVFKKIEDSGGTVDSMILSGHHKFGIFWGKNFKMTIGGMSDLMDKYPKSKASVKNLYLWGCYTNNVDKIERWLKSFPNLDYVFGFSHKAPLSNQLTGVDYLEKAMTQQADLEKMDSLSKVKDFFDKIIPGNSPDFHYVSAAIYGKSKCNTSNYKDFYYSIDHIEGGTKSSIDHFSDKGQCDDAKKVFKKKHGDNLQTYFSGEKEMLSLDAPGSKTVEKNPIRIDFYPWANKYAYCFKDSMFNVSSDLQVGLGQVLNLIYFQNIKNNFFEYFKDDIAQVKSSLSAADDKILQQLNKGHLLNRKEIIALHSAIVKILPQTKSINELNFKLDTFLIKMDDRCADVNWLEDVKDIQKPPAFCTQPM